MHASGSPPSRGDFRGRRWLGDRSRARRPLRILEVDRKSAEKPVVGFMVAPDVSALS